MLYLKNPAEITSSAKPKRKKARDSKGITRVGHLETWFLGDN